MSEEIPIGIGVSQENEVTAPISPNDVILSAGQDKRDNNKVIKIVMVFPPVGIVTHG